MKFEIDRLIDYDDDEILTELTRVAAIAPVGAFSRRVFEQHSRVSAKTVRRRFGSWEAALQQACGTVAHRAVTRYTPAGSRARRPRGDSTR
jgi:hypothetical protein